PTMSSAEKSIQLIPIPDGSNAGNTSQYTSSTCMTTSHAPIAARAGGWRLSVRESRSTNGIANCPITTISASVPQLPEPRTTYHDESAGMSPIQIIRNCEKAMYAQKMTKVNISFPSAPKCSALTDPSIAQPLRTERKASSAIIPSAETNPPANT